MNVTDQFLAEKVDAALSGYFRYLQPGLKLVATGAVEIGNPAEQRLLARYSHENPRFQARASTLILEAFHTIELLLKALLAKHGDYLVFESLDDFVARQATSSDAKKRRLEQRDRLLKKFAAISRSKKGPTPDILEAFAAEVMRSPVENFGRAVSAQLAFTRLVHFDATLGTALPEERLLRLIALRNQIVHFGDMTNLLQGIVDALQCLLSLCQWRPALFPRLARLPLRYAPRLPNHDEMMPHIMLREAWPRILETIPMLLRESPRIP